MSLCERVARTFWTLEEDEWGKHSAHENPASDHTRLELGRVHSVGGLAVGAPNDGEGSGSTGVAIYILFMNPGGTVSAHQKISATDGNLGQELGSNDAFGSAIASIADIDSNGVRDLAVGARRDDDNLDGKPTSMQGAVHMLFLDDYALS